MTQPPNGKRKGPPLLAASLFLTLLVTLLLRHPAESIAPDHDPVTTATTRTASPVVAGSGGQGGRAAAGGAAGKNQGDGGGPQCAQGQLKCGASCEDFAHGCEPARPSFETQTLVSHGDRKTRASRLLLAEVNGDGRPDLLLANVHQSESPGTWSPEKCFVSLFPGKAGGGFGERIKLAVGTSWFHAWAGDLDGDQQTDLVFGAPYQLMKGDGQGHFTLSPLDLGSRASPWFAAGDVDGDGLVDLVTLVEEKTLTVLSGGAGGHFAPPRAVGPGLDASGQTFGIQLADLDGDGRLDLLVLRRDEAEQATLSVLLSDGQGGFSIPTSLAPLGRRATSFCVQDFNGDGRPDLVTLAASASDTVSVFLAQPKGGFLPPTGFRLEAQPSEAAVADVNGDGLPDLVIGAAADSIGGHHRLLFLLGRGNGDFVAHSIPSQAPTERLVVGEISGDNRPDVIVTGANNNYIFSLINTTK